MQRRLIPSFPRHEHRIYFDEQFAAVCTRSNQLDVGDFHQFAKRLRQYSQTLKYKRGRSDSISQTTIPTSSLKCKVLPPNTSQCAIIAGDENVDRCNDSCQWRSVQSIQSKRSAFHSLPKEVKDPTTTVELSAVEEAVSMTVNDDPYNIILRIHLDYAAIDHITFSSLVPSLLRCVNLEVLTLAGNAIDDDAVVILANCIAADSMPALSKLDLSQNLLTPRGCSLLARCGWFAKNTQRSAPRVVDLSENALGVEGCLALSEALCASRTTVELSVRSCGLTRWDHGIDVIHGFSSAAPFLRSLDLSGNTLYCCLDPFGTFAMQLAASVVVEDEVDSQPIQLYLNFLLPREYYDIYYFNGWHSANTLPAAKGIESQWKSHRSNTATRLLYAIARGLPSSISGSSSPFGRFSSRVKSKRMSQ